MLRQRLLEVGQTIKIGEISVRIESIDGCAVKLSVLAPIHFRLTDPRNPTNPILDSEVPH